MRKGSANMWWIIIGAVIALVVMIVLMVLFTGKTGALETGLLSCESKGGSCVGIESNNCGQTCESKGRSYSSLFTCETQPGATTKSCCCIGVKKGEGGSCSANSDCLEGFYCPSAPTPGKCVRKT